eukprot:10040385-Heterocapsa_arctica.AAC.1
MASGEAEPPSPELIENMQDNQHIMELEALLRQARAERTAVSTTLRCPLRRLLRRRQNRD